jgi:hypothetical protein
MDHYFLTLMNWGGPLCTIQRLKLNVDELLSNVAFDFNLCHYSEDDNGQTAYFRTNNIQAAPTMITVFMADVTPPLYDPAGEYPQFRNLVGPCRLTL